MEFYLDTFIYKNLETLLIKLIRINLQDPNPTLELLVLYVHFTVHILIY